MVNFLIVPHCLDGRQNEDETDVDCGGSCKPCTGIHFYMVIICLHHLLICLAYQRTCIYLSYTIFVVSVEIKYMGIEDGTNGISWSISGTNCKSKFPSVLRPATEYKYGVSCDLAMGHSYILNCESPDGSWWKSNYVVIENSVYCEYAQGTKLSTVIITGMV